MFRLTFSLWLILGSLALAAADGKELFVENKCTRCHSIETQGVAYTGSKEAHDLSEVGNAGLDKPALKAYLKKESERDGKTHKLKFKGEDAELETLVTWLLTLK
jgi:cytochrome c551/c552